MQYIVFQVVKSRCRFFYQGEMRYQLGGCVEGVERTGLLSEKTITGEHRKDFLAFVEQHSWEGLSKKPS